MSCKPPYDYRPTMPPVADCSAPSFAEHRSRLFIGGTYFRSIKQGPEWNNISIKVETVSSPITYDLIVSYESVVKETYNVTQVPDGNGGCDINGIDLLRTAVNGVSSYIEIYERGKDVQFDSGGMDEDCLSAFVETYMGGGSGGPVDDAEITKIYTGHERTMIVISTSERQNGTPTNPPAERHVQQWNGSAWSPYQNYVQGDCPSTTLIGAPYVFEPYAVTNSPPIFDQDILDQISFDGDTISISSSATDPDGDIISYSATNLPTGVTIDINTGLISGTVDVGAIVSSPYSVIITANDGKGGIDTDDFTWEVNAQPNLPPIFDQDILDQTDDENTIVTLDSAATDPNGDIISYSAVNLPSGVTIDINTGLISGTVDFGAATNSPYNVTVTANDGKGETADDSFVWNITLPMPYYDAIIADTPIGYWRLGEASGTTATDEIGTYDGTYQGTYTQYQTSLLLVEVDKSVDFAGGTVRSTSELTGVSLGSLGTSIDFPITFEFWFSITDINAPVNSLFSTHRNVNGYSGFSMYVTASNAYIIIGDGGNGFSSSTRKTFGASLTIEQDTTYHLVIVANSISDVEMYLNGVDLNAAYLSGTGSSLDTSRGEGHIGSIQSSGVGAWFTNAVMDEVAIYNKVLTLSQVQNHYIEAGYSLYYSTIIADTPIAYWRLGESLATDPATDEIGTYTGTYGGDISVGQPSLIPAEDDTSVLFNGSSGTVNGTGVPLGNTPTNFSIEVTLKIIADNTGTGSQFIYDQRDETIGEHSIAFLYRESTKKFAINKSPSTGNEFNSTLSVVLGQTYHIVYVEDGINRYLYINGVLDNSDALAEVYTGVATNGWSIGQLGWSTASGATFNGNIDDMSLYDYSLTPAQIQDHYAAGN